jgi:histidinol-phosphate/aromatic aminotransferase/cobyric acid decarboxylase-like protein
MLRLKKVSNYWRLLKVLANAAAFRLDPSGAARNRSADWIADGRSRLFDEFCDG